MPVWLPVVIYGTTVVLGLVLGWYFLSARRPPLGLQALHLVIGLAGLEVVIAATQFSRGRPVLSEGIGIALVLLGLAAFTGLIAGTFAKSNPESTGTALLAHAGLGGIGFLVLANWALNAA